jgi:hypothetical protein
MTMTVDSSRPRRILHGDASVVADDDGVERPRYDIDVMA